MKEYIPKDAFELLAKPLVGFLENEGITGKYLAKKLKRELNAKEEKVFNDKEAGIVYSKKMIAWGIRQKARQDAHKLRGDYPAEKHQLSGANGESISFTMNFSGAPKQEDSENK